ncbi:MAG TPA: hypothetical protein VFR94_10530 [Nitrososphaeraceae archaeon]|nr:hypothetical protein [Nitrososphaeraceae archaeon]
MDYSCILLVLGASSGWQPTITNHLHPNKEKEELCVIMEMDSEIFGSSADRFRMTRTSSKILVDEPC